MWDKKVNIPTQALWKAYWWLHLSHRDMMNIIGPIWLGYNRMMV